MQSAPIWVAGEALIDLLPGGIPVVGGGPANTAKALSNLGLDAVFVGGLSSDDHGRLIESELVSYGVNLNQVNKSSLPTALAVVSIDDSGIANYEFKLSATATFDFGSWLPMGNPSVLHIGTLATIVEPGATNLFEWARSLKTRIVFDPNVRASVLDDREIYRANFERWAGLSSIVKLSDEDLEWLGHSIEEVFDFGVELVVLTHGENGLSGYRRGEKVTVQGFEVSVVDTVGAGDTVGAIVVEGLFKYGELKGEILQKVLERAAFAAAITCTRVGAKPPTLEELNR